MNPAAEWKAMRNSAQSHAALMARLHSSKAAALILSETKKFCEQPAPLDRESVAVRGLQRTALTGIKIASFAHADSMARLHPRVEGPIFEATKSICNLGLPGSEDELQSQFQESSAFTTTIARICACRLASPGRRDQAPRGGLEVTSEASLHVANSRCSPARITAVSALRISRSDSRLWLYGQRARRGDKFRFDPTRDRSRSWRAAGHRRYYAAFVQTQDLASSCPVRGRRQPQIRSNPSCRETRCAGECDHGRSDTAGR